MCLAVESFNSSHSKRSIKGWVCYIVISHNVFSSTVNDSKPLINGNMSLIKGKKKNIQVCSYECSFKGSRFS